MKKNQALQEKYPHLEVSVLTLSEVKKDNESFRIDSEYLKQEYLYLKNILLQKPHKYLSQLVSYNSRYPQPIYDKKSTMKIINSQYIRNEFIDYKNAKTGYGKVVPKESVLINSTGIGTLGRVNINLLDFDFSIDSHINVLVVKDRAIMNSCFLMIFLQTKYGQSQINRHYSGTSGQIEIYPKDFNCFLIPLLPMSFQLEIEKLVKDSHKALESSKVLYKEAENLLYESLGLDSKNPLQSILESKITDYHNLQGKSCDDKALSPNYTIATLKESFLKTGRLDAEYYQSKYEDIERFIKNYGYITLQDSEIQDKNFTPEQEKQYHYIELANIGSNGNISTPTQDFGKNLPTRARRIVKEGDVIISSIEGSLSSCALITKDFDSCLVSTGFYVLKSKHINSETLLVLFKSGIFQDYVKKFPSGTILSAISKEELQNILIPKIDSTTQESIAKHIQKSFELRTEAKNLLEKAKSEVESALNNANNGGGG